MTKLTEQNTNSINIKQHPTTPKVIHSEVLFVSVYKTEPLELAIQKVLSTAVSDVNPIAIGICSAHCFSSRPKAYHRTSIRLLNI